MAAQEKLYRDLVCLGDWLKTTHGVDLGFPCLPFGMAEPEWLRALDAALSAIRHLNATVARDRYERILQPLPDGINAAYANLFRHRNKPFADIVDELRPAGLHPALRFTSRGGDTRRTAGGGTQRSAFPDGAGGVAVDDYGFAGYWEYSIDAGAGVTTARALRTIDALSKAGGTGGSIRFVAADCADPIWDEVHHTALVPEAFASLSRQQQVDRLVASDAWRGTARSSPRPTLALSSSRDRPDVVLATLALVHTGKARDYTHYRFNYRVAVLAQRLAESGFDAASRCIENLPSYAAFLTAYRARPSDVVLISVYQHKADDMKMLAGLVREVRARRPDAFVVLEGVATQPAKQMLALFPDVDMLVRGESEAVVRALLTCKERGQPLTEAQRAEVLRDDGGRRHGVFMRTPTGGIFSGLDCEQQETDPDLLDPERHLLAVWYSERGCPSTCGYCPLYTGHQSRGRVVSAERRIEWMLDRLKLEFVDASRFDDDALCRELRSQSAGATTLAASASDPRFRLHDDTFIGHERVNITIVSQNALVNRSIWLTFCRDVADLGLHKYFRIKIADTAIMTLWRNRAADRELIRALKGAGVFFIGFGTESLSERILNDLRKGHGHRDSSDYHADAPIEIVAALREEGFPVEGIRHNFMSNAPESRLEHVKEGMVLAYVGPLFNHSLEHLGSGWGNARENRLYAMEGSLHTAVDSLRYGRSYHVPLPDTGTVATGVSLLGEFFVCHDAPEYRIRREDGRLTYIDERLQPLATAFTYPTFYRYAMTDVLRTHVSQDDIDSMCAHWACGSSNELRALARVVEQYQQADPTSNKLSALFRLKAHMLASECVRFTDWEQRLDLVPALPRELEKAGITRLIAEADDSMRPAAFDASRALARLMLSARRARLTWRACQQAHPDAGEWAATMAGGSPHRLSSEALDAVHDLEVREAECRRRGLHTSLSYPDSQQFHDLCRACPAIPAETLFEQLTQEIRTTRATVATAVRNIACRVVELADAEYDEFVKLLKGYDTISLFAAGGPLSLLHCSNPAARDRARQELRRVLGDTAHPMMRRFLEHSLALAS